MKFITIYKIFSVKLYNNNNAVLYYLFHMILLYDTTHLLVAVLYFDTISLFLIDNER